MNIIRMTGGLGNQMFQYALSLSYKRRGIESKFEDWTEYDDRDNKRPISLSVFDINYQKASMEEYIEYTDSDMSIGSRIRRKLTGRRSREYSETPFTYDEHVLLLDNSYVTGYFQSERYFIDVRDEVLDAFSFNEDTRNRAKQIPQAKLIGDNTVSIHIRRGDYLLVSEVYGNICTEEYYDKCVRFFVDKIDNPNFLVFSNDSEWTGEWMKKYQDEGILINLVEGTTENTGYLDMCLMQQCHHHIIANSSFSWWGAYLSQKNYDDGITLCPSRWNNKCDQTDIYTDRMNKI